VGKGIGQAVRKKKKIGMRELMEGKKENKIEKGQ
jgi:hypothetical protein